MNGVEIFGYFASLLVILSMTMKDIFVLRLINSFACGCFVVYGILIGAIPVILMNLAVIGINAYKIYTDGKE
jgi:hypothetical protein